MQYAAKITEVIQIGPMACPTQEVQRTITETKVKGDSKLIAVLGEESESFWDLIKSEANKQGMKATSQNFRLFGIMSKVHHEMIGPAYRISFAK